MDFEVFFFENVRIHIFLILFISIKLTPFKLIRLNDFGRIPWFSLSCFIHNIFPEV